MHSGRHRILDLSVPADRLTTDKPLAICLSVGEDQVKAKRSIAVDAAVGARIRNLRLRSGLSQTEVGEQVGVSFQQIQKYEKGTNRVSAGRLAQLAKLFGVSIAAFYSEVAAHLPETFIRLFLC